MTSVGYIDNQKIYFGEYNGDLYGIRFSLGGLRWELFNNNSTSSTIFYAENVTELCDVLDTDWTVEDLTYFDYCEGAFDTPLLSITSLSDDDVNCGYIFSGGCSCKEIVIEPGEGDVNIFYQTCDGNIVQQLVQPNDNIIGCFSGDPIVLNSSFATITDYNDSTCSEFCITGNTCCLKFTINSETGGITVNTNPIGTYNGYSLYTFSIGEINFIIYFDSVTGEWIIESEPVLGKIFSLETKDPASCPVGTWTSIGSSSITGIETEEITCVYPSPTLTQTPTPTPTPSPTPTLTPPPTPPPTSSSRVRTVNECEPITILDMEVYCVVLEPSSKTSNDGAASLLISGGTPPYTIIWDNGNISPAIGNLSVGSYGATVVDFYGDFTAKTVCVLTGQTPTPPPTPPPTSSPIPTGQQFCMSFDAQFTNIVDSETQTVSISFEDNFIVDSFINSKPSWGTIGGAHRIYWEPSPSPGFWKLSASTTPFPLVINYNSSEPPTNPTDWIITAVLPGYTLNITNGSCSGFFGLNPYMLENPNIELFVVKNNTICGCEGSIVANATGGNTPYQFSIDGGVTYKNFPIFDNLCSGDYTVTVKDVSGYTKSLQVTINPPQLPTTYAVKLTNTSTTPVNNGLITTKTYQSKIEVTPPLPNSVTITFDIVHNNLFSTSTTQESALLTTNTILEKNSTPISYTNSNLSTGTTTNTLNGCQDQLIYFSSNTEIWEGLTYTNSDEVIINTTTSVVKNFLTGCDIGASEDKFYLTNVKITGCNCCNVQNITI